VTVIAVEDEGGLRIDYCEQCMGYLKTTRGKEARSFCLPTGLQFSWT
jgi:hypothetical protein